MSYKVTDSIDALTGQTKQRASTFLRLACEDVLSNSKPKTPKKLGNLSRDVIRQVLGLHGTIEWRKTYASYQERGARADGSRRVKKYTTPGTGPNFARNAVEKTVQSANGLLRMSHLI